MSTRKKTTKKATKKAVRKAVPAAPAEDKLQTIWLLLGQRYMREHQDYANFINNLIKERKEWSGQVIYNYANQQFVTTQVRDSMAIKDDKDRIIGVVANQAVMGRLTNDMQGNPGTMSRRNPLNAIAMAGGDFPQAQLIPPVRQ